MKVKFVSKIAVIMSAFTMVLPSVAMASSTSVYVNGNILEVDQPPLIEQGRTFVPLRAIGEALGCQVEWDNDTRSASFIQGDVKAVITIGEPYIMIGDGVYDEQFPIDAPAIIRGGRTLVPLRAMSECFGYEVDWNGDENAVYIKTGEMDQESVDSADEQTAIDSEVSTLMGTVEAYASILKGATDVIDAVNFESDEFTKVKEDLNTVLDNVLSMDYNQLMTAFSNLKECEKTIVGISAEAGIDDIVADYLEKSNLEELLKM